MKRFIIFGNSGSGKSTLAQSLCRRHGVAHLDLDTIAWLPGLPPTRAPLDQSRRHIVDFTTGNEGWVIEGCYADLLDLVTPLATEMVFLDLPVPLCQENARHRPWESHKYASKEEQDANLAMLLDWIAAYDTRADEFSRAAHERLFQAFPGRKERLTANREILD